MRSYDCQKCGAIDRVASDTKLVGGQYTRLCNECRNEWHAVVIKRDEYKELQLNDAELAAALSAGDRKMAVKLMEIRAELKNKLFYFSREWMSEKFPVLG